MKNLQLIPLCAALFWACSDSPNVTGTTIIDNTMGQNSSSSKTTSSSSQPTSSSEFTPTFAMSTQNGIKLGSCIADGITGLAKRTSARQALAKEAAQTTAPATSEKSSKAYILYNSKGEYQVLLLNVSDYCSVFASILTTRLGDTLEIEYGGEYMELAKCICVSDHWFDIKAEDKDVKYIRFKGKIYEVNGDPILVHTRDESDYPVLTDPRDGKTYKTLVIYEQLWMAENLNYEMEDEGQSWCYENKQENCDKYGRLYNFEAAKAACPPGWHIPSDPEWGELLMYNYTKESWDNFAIQPLGEYSADSLKFIDPGETAQFWTSSLDTLNNNCHSTAYFSFDKETPERPHSMRSCSKNKNDGLPLRCMKD